ncbi:MAG: hypothetical protein IT385_02730 [Deltaproteobacteria bacterium]|nr:hypothetical protein [Deltaproteobacteria bacterium]
MYIGHSSVDELLELGPVETRRLVVTKCPSIRRGFVMDAGMFKSIGPVPGWVWRVPSADDPDFDPKMRELLSGVANHLQVSPDDLADLALGRGHA